MAVNVSSPKVFIGLIVKLCCLPYCFSTMAMTGVGKAAMKTVEEVQRHFNTNPGLRDGRTKPEYATSCVKMTRCPQMPH